jgi:hypothetical protein
VGQARKYQSSRDTFSDKQKERIMSDLVVFAFDTETGAREMGEEIKKL